MPRPAHKTCLSVLLTGKIFMCCHNFCFMAAHFLFAAVWRKNLEYFLIFLEKLLAKCFFFHYNGSAWDFSRDIITPHTR